MRIEDSRKGLETAIVHCPARDLCPMKSLCGVTSSSDHPTLFPTLMDVEQSNLLWVDLRLEQRVFVIRSGIYSCVSNLETSREIPISLLGRGYVIGLSELYIPREIASSYYLRALTPGTVCSFSAKAVRRRLEELPPTLSNSIISCSLINLTSAAYTQVKTLSRSLAGDRIAMLLLRLRELAARENRTLETIDITHGNIASLVSSDRVSITRALHKMEEAGFVELGYRSVKLTDAIGDLDEFVADAQTTLHNPTLPA